MFLKQHDPQELLEALDSLAQVWTELALQHPENPRFRALVAEINEVAELVYENPEKASRASCILDITEIDLSYPLVRQALGISDNTEIYQSLN